MLLIKLYLKTVTEYLFFNWQRGVCSLLQEFQLFTV